MGWQERPRGTRGYYKPARLAGEPRNIYVGSRKYGRRHELLDRRQRLLRAADRAALMMEKAEQVEIDEVWFPIWLWSRTIAAAALLTAGWYNHHGEWRKKMSRPRTRSNKADPAAPPEGADVRTRLEHLNKRANAGDNRAFAELHALLDAHPEVWREQGDLARVSEYHLAKLIAGPDTLQVEEIVRFHEEWKNELAGPTPSPAERALADAAGVAKLILARAEFRARDTADPMHIAKFKAGQLDSALHRYTATVKLLTQVQAARATRPVPAAPAAAASGPRIFDPAERRRKVG